MSEAPMPNFESFQKSIEAIAERLRDERNRRQLERRPPNTLHVRPNLDHYRDRAWRLHTSQRKQHPTAKLHSAQLEIARGLGFASWRKLADAIKGRREAANQLCAALARRDREAILRIARDHPHAVFDGGCIVSPEELRLLIDVLSITNRNSKLRTALLDAVAEHHRPEGLGECCQILTGWSEVNADYAADVIWNRQQRVEDAPDGERMEELFEEALGVLAWVTDPPDDSEYMTESD
jgi:hypothetical protein